MRKDLTTWLPILLLVLMGALAGIGNLLQTGVGSDSSSDIPNELLVTTRSDRGPGSLRTALFTAMKAPHRVTIRLDIDYIDIDVALPPVAATGLTIIGRVGDSTIIRQVGESNSANPLLNIIADDVSLSHLHLDAAGTKGIYVAGKRTNVQKVSIENASIAIDGTNVSALSVQDSVFTDNDMGIRLGGGSATTRISANTFRDNRDSSVWIALSSDKIHARNEIQIHDNQITGGKDGLIVVNAGVDIRSNRISNFSHAGLSLLNARAMVTGNRIIDSAGIGMHVSQLVDSVIIDNELARNQQIGILIVDAEGLQVDRNQVYENGYGIAAVGLHPINASVKNNTIVGQTIDGLIAIGESPFIDGNHALRNRQAGIRIMDLLLPDQALIVAIPRLANNTLTDNGENAVQRGEYVVARP